MSENLSSFNDLGRLLRYARDHHGRIALATLCSVLNKLFDIMPEILIGMAIDVVVGVAVVDAVTVVVAMAVDTSAGSKRCGQLRWRQQ